MEHNCDGFIFFSNFDSGNLAKAELVDNIDSNDDIDFEFNVWTRPDCAGSEFENGYRSWFYFGIKGGKAHSTIKINIINLNKQTKMYSQGMTPLYKIIPGKPKWERIKDKPTFLAENGQFSLSFKYRLGETGRSVVYFAFTYPFTYTESQSFLNSLELMQRLKTNFGGNLKPDDIYYHRELLCYSLEGRRLDLITISSHHNITQMKEPRLPNLFPDLGIARPFIFIEKKVIFLSARVHPGETPSSFILNGMLQLLTNKDDPISLILRKHFVFKIIPMLNPDGVYNGNYRTDTKGVNLNRVYMNPSPEFHPSIYGARSVLRYAHYNKIVPDDVIQPNLKDALQQMSLFRLREMTDDKIYNYLSPSECDQLIENVELSSLENIGQMESGLYLYIDMHGHASKKGIFMYGNHFQDINDNIDCMLFPKLVSLNSQHFQFESCNFSERIMYIKDKKGGGTREGAGRVAAYKLTGLIRSYTLECNYNTGKILNQLPVPVREGLDKKPLPVLLIPPKYTPQIFEEVGRSVLNAILDLTSLHPNSRIPNSHHRTLNGIREWLRTRINNGEKITAIKKQQQQLQPKTNLQVRDFDDSTEDFESLSADCLNCTTKEHLIINKNNNIDNKSKESSCYSHNNTSCCIS